MSFTAAKTHEKSEEHVYQIEKEEQWHLKDSWGVAAGDNSDWLGMKESDWTTKADKLTLIVEYWYKGVQAADRGEELKFELFLETLDD